MIPPIVAIKHSVAGHEGLTGAAFLTGAAVEDYGAGQFTSFNGFFNGDCGAYGTGTQQVVTAALAAAVGGQGLLFRGPGFLGQAGQGIVFTQNADDGLAGAVGAGESGGDAAEVLIHGEALFL